MSKAEQTRQRIIQETAVLFNTKGYSATSLSDIEAVTGLTKGSVYGNFKSKDEVVVEVFKYNAASRDKALKTALSKTTNPLDALVTMVNFYRKSLAMVDKSGGCPMLNAATEADDHLLFLKETVQHHFLAWQQVVINIIESGQAQGLFRSEISPKSYASLFIMLIEGGILLARSLNDKNHLDLALDRLLKIIEDEIRID